VRAAINIVRLVDVMRDKWVGQNRKPLHAGVGINSGEVIAGDAGFAQRREYTVVGPPVAFAHRLANATSDLNAYIVVSRETLEPIKDLYDVVPVSGIPLAGQRALLDASIIRGRKRSDDLTLPKAEAFATTVIDGKEVELPESLTAEVPPRRAPEPPAPEPPPLRTRPVKPRPSYSGPERRGFDLPELRFPASFGEHDEEPIMPEPPPPRATYEDKGGPPLPL
jgi:hypothetical protein